ncbi:hypothetical protein MAR_029509 [Mya arenaria]|uniref:Uncharacterized protein n=1 Tax=Mya arenaria TaxID=6604 RepID=A0ABY7DHM8_MYAAR|nr:splicing regulatory glutamine/lysine-rich protein 1-like [Mya arenaria]XP_052759718.1 splicing regulatory glutamine/lysine-rich protein 1-like [Mya arenaria]XP_052759728.1 splicing regulatory glutamine/lysine-rich protein 1-like [Mya arenaria]XP_052759733.1 splicing regulatory glutamine/lysine-rich protein 1-like [Mya arenaria]XP_052759742.1 splicing regulatory glutamine/lysine-rich protein 1-like [Mya arenaria]XP_052759751.1 splicing regulatory glutamine/lysine-rich protein 1-like [Mya are
MALTTGELAAVISGSIGGLIIILASIALILYYCVRRSRKRRRADHKPFPHHHLTPDTSLSKTSLPRPGDPRDPRDARALQDPRIDPRLDPRIIDPRLPKVGSASLWFGNPSLYSATPSQAYQDMKRGKVGGRPPDQPLPGLQGPPGHMVYTGGNAGRGIYHSQQVASPMYEQEYRIPRSGSYMDLYSYPYNYDPYRDINNSRAVLVELPEKEEYYLDRYRERETRRTGKKVRRSQSDVTLHSTRRPKNRKQRGETPFDKTSTSRDSDDRGSREREGLRASRDSYERVEGRDRDSRERRGSRDWDGARKDRTTVVDVHKPKKQAPPPPQPKPRRDEVEAKARNFSDPELGESATDSAKLRAIERERERERERAREKKLERELDKVIEKDNRAFVPDEDLHVRPYSYTGKPVQQSTKYENSIVAKMAALTETPKATYIRPSDNFSRENLPQGFHAEVTKKLENLKSGDGVPKSIDTTEGPVATSTGKHSRASRPTSAREQRRSRRSSNVTDADGNIVDAFEFLDGYSDGEGTDFHGSGMSTPTPARDTDINL